MSTEPSEVIASDSGQVGTSAVQADLLQAVLYGVPDPVIAVDGAIRVRALNPAALRLLNASGDVSADAAVGQALISFEGGADLVALVTGKGIVARGKDAYAAHNGRFYDAFVSAYRDRDGQDADAAGRVLVLRDVTRERLLHDNTDEFLSTVSHDLRSPLTFMSGYLDMMGMIGELNERQTQFVEKISSGVHQMSDLVEKVLDAGKLDPVTGNYELLREPTDVKAVFDKVVQRLVAPAEKNQQKLVWHVDDGVPILNVDRAMLSSAFTNLAENALKYTPAGGSISVELRVVDGALQFSVSDDGLGISTENQKKLFQRNVRVPRKEWARVKGTGLGLFIVKNVAQRHGGSAWVESAEGNGSTFIISIPLDGANLVGSS